MARALLLAAQVFYAIVRAYQTWRHKERVSVVRADPGAAWLRKFGGAADSADHAKRAAAAPVTPGALVTDSWYYEIKGALIVRDGSWVHLPAAEAGELLLWIEAAEKGR